MAEFSWILFFGGLSFFFFGLAGARNALQLLAGDRLRFIITRLTNNRLTALSLGTLITVTLQSSTATILMLISLAATGLLTLPQAFGVILGADIGTTAVVILLSIKQIADYSLLLVVIGFGVEWLARGSKQARHAGRILFSFGMVFYGMQLITQTAKPMALDPNARFIFTLLTDHPIAMLILSVFFTILVQTSAATIGMVIALALAGAVTLPAAIPVVLGANIGTCFSPLLASLTSNSNGRRVAVAHLFVKVTGVLLVMPFIPQVAAFMEQLSLFITRWIPFIHPDVAGQIAIIHLAFNVALALFFLPLLPLGVWVVSKFLVEGKQEEVFGPKYLEEGALETPPLAFAHSKREILRIANLTYDLYRDCLKMFDASPDLEQLLREIGERDDKIDLLDREVRFYLAKIAREVLTDAQATQQMSLLSITADLEGIGDVVSKEMAGLARKKGEKKRQFSQEGWRDIQELHRMGLENFSLVISCFASPGEDLLLKVTRQREYFNELEQQFRQQHIRRLHVGTPEAFETSSIHLDVLGNLRRINDHLVHLAQLSLQS